MLCPKCHSTTFVLGQRCHRCGYQEPADDGFTDSSLPRISGRKVAKLSDNLSFEFARQEPDRLPAMDWKKELRQKLAQAQERKGRASGARSTEPNPAPLGTTSPTPKSPEIKRTAVDPQPISKASYDMHRNLLDFQASIQRSPSEKNENPAAAAARRPSVQRDLPKSLNATRASSAAAHG